jgi:hypothetical protein
MAPYGVFPRKCLFIYFCACLSVCLFDEEGTDSENGPLRGLALREAIQAVHDGMEERDSRV